MLRIPTETDTLAAMTREPPSFPDPIHRAFARRVRALRVEREWSQGFLAEKMTEFGVPMDRTAIARIEQAAIESEAKLKPRKVSISEAAGFAAAFHVPLAAVLPYDERAFDYSEPVTRQHFDRRMDEFNALATGKSYEAVRVARVREEAEQEKQRTRIVGKDAKAPTGKLTGKDKMVPSKRRQRS
jgi:transcriptional regulator with XRE-family HTH domain